MVYRGSILVNVWLFEKIDEIKDFANGISCKFEEAYKNASISGEILSYIIGSKNFFGNAKINLVGHSLGCRVIYCCLEELKTDYKNLTGIINDIIFLAGATELSDDDFGKIVKEYVNGRFIHCFNTDDEVLFISHSLAN